MGQAQITTVANKVMLAQDIIAKSQQDAKNLNLPYIKDEKDKQNLLLNTSAFGGKNIYRSLPSIQKTSKDGYILECVEIPIGTWFYKASRDMIVPEELQNANEGSWYGSLEVAKFYAEQISIAQQIQGISNPVYILASRSKVPLTLMILNKKKNITGILEEKDILHSFDVKYQSQLKELSEKVRENKEAQYLIEERVKELNYSDIIKIATGVNISTWEQLKKIRKFGQKGNWLDIAVSLSAKALFVPTRFSNLSLDKMMMNSFCTIWNDKYKNKIDGYIASYLDTLFGDVFLEEIAICSSKIKSTFDDPITITMETTNTLILEHSFLSNTWYTIYKKKIAKNYGFYALLLFLGASLKAYQMHKIKDLNNQLTTNFEILKKNCDQFKNVEELIATILFQSAYFVPAELFFKDKKVESITTICNDLSLKTSNGMFENAFKIWVRLLSLFSLNIFLQILSAVFNDNLKTKLAKKIVLNQKWLENIPDFKTLDNNNKLIKLFGKDWKAKTNKMSDNEIRQTMITNNKKLLALILFNQDGILRSKNETLSVFSILG